MKIKKFFNYLILFFLSLISFFTFLPPLTSCSVQNTFIKLNTDNDVFATKNSHIDASCDFYGLNPKDFSWKIEKGFLFDDSFLDLEAAHSLENTRIVNSTMFISIPLTDNIPDYDTFYFDFSIIFYSLKDSSIFKKTSPIRVNKNLYSPIIVGDFSVSPNEWPKLDEKYFVQKGKTFPNCFETIDFLDIVEKDEKGCYKSEDLERIKQILKSDFVCYSLFSISNLKKLKIKEAPFLTINYDYVLCDFKYKYNIETKTFEELKINIVFNGNIVTGMLKFTLKIGFDFHGGYKIIGTCIKNNKTNVETLSDDKRILLGNFFSLVPCGEDSYYIVHFEIDSLSIPLVNSEHFFWMNASRPCPIASFVYRSGDTGLFIPCYNLNGNEFTTKYLDINYYQDSSKADEIFNLLLVKENEPFDISNKMKTDIKWYIKKDLIIKDIPNLHFNDLEEKEKFKELFSDERNNCWKNILITIDGKEYNIPWYWYMSRISVENTDGIKETLTKKYISIIFNGCFCSNGSRMQNYQTNNLVFVE